MTDTSAPTGHMPYEHERVRVSRRFLVLYALALSGVWMAILTPAGVTVALRIGDVDPDGKTLSYSLVTGVGTLVALLANPFFGRLSDITRSRYGMRRPWIVGGMLAGGAGALLIALFDNVFVILVGWIIMQASINAAIAALVAILGDRVPDDQQGVVGGIAGMAPSAALVLGTFLVQLFPDDALASMGIPVVAGIVFAVVFALTYRDRTPSGPRPTFGFRELVGTFVFNPLERRDFALLLVSLALLQTGTAVVANYTVYYLEDGLGIADDRVPFQAFVANFWTNATGVVASLLAGWIVGRFVSHKVLLMISGVIMTVGVLSIIVIPGLSGFTVGNILIGSGSGLYLGIYLSYATMIMDDPRNVARDLGLVNIAYALPLAVSPFVAPVLLGIGHDHNYALLLGISAIVTAVGIPIPLFIRHQKPRLGVDDAVAPPAGR